MKTLTPILLLGFLCLNFNAIAEPANFIAHHRIKAERGDGVITMLKRYDLYDHSCNIAAFYDINQLKKNAMIYAGKEYILPIRIYQYNKTSIRSTIGKNDWDLAKRIASYNRLLRERKLKKTYYMDDAILYVPFHLLECPDAATVKNKAKAISVKSAEPKKVYLENALYGSS